MLLPGVTVQRSGLRDSVTADFSGRIAAERRMRARMSAVFLENPSFRSKSAALQNSV